MNRLACVALALAAANPAGATEIVYTPVNPSFGGNPLNGGMLLNIANAINKYKDPELESALSAFKIPTSQDLFNQQLQSIILGKIASTAANAITDQATGKLMPGVIDTGTFLISVVNGPTAGTLIITTLDKVTGASSSFQISQ